MERTGQYPQAGNSHRSDRTAGSGQHRLLIRGLGLSAAALGSVSFAGIAEAGPVGGTVVGGSATISRPDSKTTVINQSSQRAVIDWQDFSNGRGELIDFRQPGASSLTLNRVTGNKASEILGSIRAPGQVWLVNPNGIFFGSSAQIDVGGLVATTSRIGAQEFMSAKDRFTFSSGGQGNVSIVNQGNITVAEGGLVALVAPGVANDGTITARLGRVTLAAGEAFTIDLFGDQLVEFAIPQDAPVNSNLRAVVQGENGKISADGGRVTIDVDQARNAVNNVISMAGVVEANSVVEKNGEILLLGGDETVARVSGRLQARGDDAGETGGLIEIRAAAVSLEDGARLNAAGIAGGGSVLAGGDKQGQGEGQRAEVTVATSDVEINVDAEESGDGGKAIVWADDLTIFAGKVSAKGGEESGDGGFVEVSGKEELVMLGDVDTSAANGKKGQLLLDPDNVYITGLDVNAMTGTAGITSTAALWMNAQNSSSFSFSSGNSISGWDSEDGPGQHNAYNGTGAAQPTLVASGINGHQAVEFDGTDDMLYMNSHSDINSAGNYPAKTVLMMLQTGTDLSTASNQYDIIYEQGGSGNGLNFYLNNGKVQMNMYNGSEYGYIEDPNAATANTAGLYAMRFDGSQAQANRLYGYVNGETVAATDTFGASTLSSHGNANGFGGGNSSYKFPGNVTNTGPSNTGKFDGMIGEMLVFNEALSDEAMTLVQQAMAGRWSQDLGNGANAADSAAVLTPHTNSYVHEAYLEHLATKTDITLQADTDITITDLSDNVLDIGAHNLTLEADFNNDGVGKFTMNATDTIQGSSGNVTISAAEIDIGNVNTSGRIDLTASNGNLAILAGATLTGGGTLLKASGDITGDVDVATLATTGATATLTGTVGSATAATSYKETQLLSGAGVGPHTINGEDYPWNPPVVASSSTRVIGTLPSRVVNPVSLETPGNTGSDAHGGLETRAEASFSTSTSPKPPMQIIMCEGETAQACKQSVLKSGARRLMQGLNEVLGQGVSYVTLQEPASDEDPEKPRISVAQEP